LLQGKGDKKKHIEPAKNATDATPVTEKQPGIQRS